LVEKYIAAFAQNARGGFFINVFAASPIRNNFKILRRAGRATSFK
jgi:hypothetical protein